MTGEYTNEEKSLGEKQNRFIVITSAKLSLVKRIWAIGISNWEKRLSYKAMSLPCPTAATAYTVPIIHFKKVLHTHFNFKYMYLYTYGNISHGFTWTWERCFGLFGRASRLNPTPTAPLETRMTLCPSFLNWTMVSTNSEREESRGK